MLWQLKAWRPCDFQFKKGEGTDTFVRAVITCTTKLCNNTSQYIKTKLFPKYTIFVLQVLVQA